MSESLNQNALKAGLWYTVSNILLQGLNFITMPIFTRILSKSDYGAFSNYASWLNLLVVLTTLNLYSSIQRAYYDFREDLPGYLSTIFLTGASATAILYLIVVCFHGFFSSLFGMNMIYVHIMFLQILLMPALQMLQTASRFQMRYKMATTLTISSSVAATAISIVLVLSMQDKLTARIIGNSGTIAAINLVLAGYIILKGHRFRPAYSKYAVAIAVPLIPHLLGSSILGQTDRILIMKFWGSDATALYSVVFNCSLLVTVLMTSLNQAWTPWLFEHLHREDYGPIRKAHKPFILSFCLLVFGIMLLAPEAVRILGGTKYMESIYMMPPIMLGLAYYFMYSLFVNTETYHKKTFGISVRTISAAALNLVLNIFLIPRLGYTAAAYVSLVSYFVLFVMHYFAAKKLGVAKYFDCKFIFLTAGALLGMAGIALALYNFPLARYAAVVLYAGILAFAAFKSRETLLTLLSTFRRKQAGAA